MDRLQVLILREVKIALSPLDAMFTEKWGGVPSRRLLNQRLHQAWLLEKPASVGTQFSLLTAFNVH